MQQETGHGNVVAVGNLTEFFRDALRGFLCEQHLAPDVHSGHYVVNLTTAFACSELLDHSKPNDRGPLLPAQLLATVFDAKAAAERELALRAH